MHASRSKVWEYEITPALRTGADEMYIHTEVGESVRKEQAPATTHQQLMCSFPGHSTRGLSIVLLLLPASALGLGQELSRDASQYLQSRSLRHL